MASYASYANSHISRKDSKPSDSNKAFLNVGIPWRLEGMGIEYTLDLEANSIALGGAVHAVTNLDLMGHFDDSATSGSKFVDDTTDASDAGTADVLFSPATEEDELDYALFGNAAPFHGIETVLSTQGAGGTVAFEYLASSGTWTALTYVVDASTGFTAGTSTYDTSWELPEDWAPMVHAEVTLTLSEADTPRYYVRARIKSVYSTNPVGTQVQAYEIGSNVTVGHQAPSKGVVTHLNIDAGTASASNNDTILEFINHTQQTRGWVTITQAVVRGRYAFTVGKAFRVNRGDVVTFHGLQEDGSTEFQDVAITLEIEL
jgi:hypothetical protein